MCSVICAQNHVSYKSKPVHVIIIRLSRLHFGFVATYGFRSVFGTITTPFGFIIYAFVPALRSLAGRYQMWQVFLLFLLFLVVWIGKKIGSRVRFIVPGWIGVFVFGSSRIRVSARNMTPGWVHVVEHIWLMSTYGWWAHNGWAHTCAHQLVVDRDRVCSSSMQRIVCPRQLSSTPSIDLCHRATPKHWQQLWIFPRNRGNHGSCPGDTSRRVACTWAHNDVVST